VSQVAVINKASGDLLSAWQQNWTAKDGKLPPSTAGRAFPGEQGSPPMSIIMLEVPCWHSQAGPSTSLQEQTSTSSISQKIT